ncbi:hypothetical protein NQ317_015967 [Molorchus minor]|uniref:Uncharacterized protein n=1 Tax=Molorchus minor TaxID=1323400 RepID=A0ABQ9JL93_9CUCU|nr:hypothetical protein NQ317_015967 [Molorchus minor]
MPQVLVSGKNETACLSLHETVLPARAIIDFKWKEKHFPTVRNLDSGSYTSNVEGERWLCFMCDLYDS